MLNDLIGEIKKKGPVTGIKSLLHKKSNYYFDDVENDGTMVRHYDISQLSMMDYDTQKKIILPLVSNPTVSIIVPMYNEVMYTYNCIHSIFANNDLDNYEIIIADDNSTDNTDILKQNFENLIIVRNEANLGFLRNCNNAATKARGEYIVFLNNDTQVQKDWLAELLYIFKHYKNVGLVGSKLVYPDGSLQEAGGIIWRDGSASNYGNSDNPQKPQYNYLKEVDYISGASIMLTMKLWRELGGFDERYLPAYCEDSDLCFRVREKGLKVMYQPFSVVVHFEGVSHGTNLGTGVKKYQLINRQKLYDRWKDTLKTKSKVWENAFGERDRTIDKKHVLVIDHYLPQIDKDAGSRTISNFIDVLLDLGYSVKFLGENSNTGRHYQKQFQLKGVEVLYGNQFNFATKSWRHYLKTNLENFDAILLSRSSVCTPVLAFLKHHKYKGNVIYYGHDLGYQRLEKEGLVKQDDSLLKLAKKIKEQEDFMYKNATNSLAISSEEIAFLRGYITKPIHYVPPYFFETSKDATPFEGRSGIFFVGGFNHPPNQDAMKWFLDEVYESLDKQNIHLTIAGSKMPDFIFNYQQQYPSLTVLPDVSIEALSELYEKTRLAVVPLRSGAGVKGKVIEAMAKGVPVVGTDIAFEGMPKDEGYLYKGVNTPEAMIKEIERVYTNKEAWVQLSAFGKEYVASNFNKDNMKQVFRDIIEGGAANPKQK